MAHVALSYGIRTQIVRYIDNLTEERYIELEHFRKTGLPEELFQRAWYTHEVFGELLRVVDKVEPDTTMHKDTFNQVKNLGLPLEKSFTLTVKLPMEWKDHRVVESYTSDTPPYVTFNCRFSNGKLRYMPGSRIMEVPITTLPWHMYKQIMDYYIARKEALMCRKVVRRFLNDRRSCGQMQRDWPELVNFLPTDLRAKLGKTKARGKPQYKKGESRDIFEECNVILSEQLLGSKSSRSIKDSQVTCNVEF